MVEVVGVEHEPVAFGRTVRRRYGLQLLSAGPRGLPPCRSAGHNSRQKFRRVTDTRVRMGLNIRAVTGQTSAHMPQKLQREIS